MGRVSRGKVRLLFGARQVGKTSVLRHVAGVERTASYDLQKAVVRRRFEADPGLFSREVAALTNDITQITVVEIQKVPPLLDEIQALYDERPRRNWLLTGSSSRRLRAGAANLLPGRAHVYHLQPVCRWEDEDWRPAVDLLGPPTPTIPIAPGTPKFSPQTLERALLYGDLPGIRLEESQTAAATLAAYVDAYLEEEIRREAMVRDIGAFSEFLRLTAVESGRIVNVAALSRDSGVPQSTIRIYRQILEDTFVGMPLRPYGRATRKRLLTAPRFYLFDLGVRTAAAGLPFDPGVLATEGGPMLEHWVGLELMRRAGYRGRGFSVSFWRTVGGAEVDFVYETPKEDLPIEVKWSAKPSPTDARHLELFLDTYPARARRGLLVCRAPARQKLTDRVLAIPWQEL